MELSEQIKRGAARMWPGTTVLLELALVVVFLTSLASIVYGVSLVSEPAAYIAAGVLGATLVALYVRGD